MSRAINVTAPLAEVKATAASHGASISAIEAIMPAGTRVVFTNGEDAARMRVVFADRMVTGAVTRAKWVRND